MEIDEKYEEKDDSRPFFQRQPCEVGIYISVLDACAKDEKSVGLHHFFLMHTTELLYEQFSKMDKVNIRAAFERRHLFYDSYVERFEPGIVMAIGFDNLDALDALWELHKRQKLDSLLHEILTTSEVMEKASVKNITLETKLWYDEYESCKSELETRSMNIVDVKHRDADMRMLRRLKAYQSVLGVEVSAMRDLENEMELNRTEFMNCIRNVLSDDNFKISSLREYDGISKSEKARKQFHKDLLDLYSSIILKWRSYYRTFELEIVTPLLQIHSVCENEKQKETKAKIIKGIRDMQKMLQSDYNLQTVSHPDMERKVIRRDAPAFVGLFSLITIGVERLADTDILIDDYVREFRLELHDLMKD